MKTVSFKLPEDLDARIERAVKRRGGSKSDLVRKAVLKYLPREESAGVSFLERSGKLAGCVDGPADLSTGSRHLEGYGE